MKFLGFLILSALFISCQNKQAKEVADPESNEPKVEKSNINASDTAARSGNQLILPPGTEEAETLVARYYSTRNREKLYPFYKGLGLKILEIDRITGTDSFRIEAKVTGRKWPNPNKDTLTIPFEENRTIRAIKQEKEWQADSIGLH